MAENHDFGITAFHDIADDIDSFIHLGVVSRFLVENVSAVTNHPHLTEQQQHTFPVLVTEKMHSLPLGDQLGDIDLELIVQLFLLRSHWHEQILVGTVRELDCDIGLAPAEKPLGYALAYLVQIPVGHYLAAAVLHRGVIHELVIWSQAILVHEFHYGIKFIQLVFQRSSGKDHGIVRLYLSRGPGYLAVPVLQPLNFVHYQAFRTARPEDLDVIAQRMIGDYLVERLRLVDFPALVLRPFHDCHVGIRKALNLFLPLVFQ